MVNGKMDSVTLRPLHAAVVARSGIEGSHVRATFIVLIGLLGWSAIAAAQTSPSADSPRSATVNAKALMADASPAPVSPLVSLDRAIEASQEDAQKARLELAAANWLLARSIASPATRCLLGFAEKNDLHRIHEAAGDAQIRLARARKLLKTDADKDKAALTQLRQSATALEAFAKMLLAISTESDDSKQACEDAAVNLATARESENELVAAAALLWQAYAWDRAGKTERALTTLPDALTPPQRLPFDFMSRLLRCRMLAETKEWAAAVSLLMRMRTLTEEWFGQEDNAGRRSRRRLIGLLQHEITQEWLAQLKTKDAAERIRKTLSKISEELSSEDGRMAVYHLETAVPVLVELPEGQTSPAEPAAPMNEKASAEKPGANPAASAAVPTQPAKASTRPANRARRAHAPRNAATSAPASAPRE